MDLNSNKLGDSGGQRSLVCYSPWGHKESDTTERLNNDNTVWWVKCVSKDLLRKKKHQPIRAGVEGGDRASRILPPSSTVQLGKRLFLLVHQRQGRTRTWASGAPLPSGHLRAQCWSCKYRVPPAS